MVVEFGGSGVILLLWHFILTLLIVYVSKFKFLKHGTIDNVQRKFPKKNHRIFSYHYPLLSL
jgi:hypothetical protein